MAVDANISDSDGSAIGDELRPCPFCDSADVRSGGDDKVVGVWCLSCGASGPNGYQSDTEWNSRPQQDEAEFNEDEIWGYFSREVARREALEAENKRLRDALADASGWLSALAFEIPHPAGTPEDAATRAIAALSPSEGP